MPQDEVYHAGTLENLARSKENSPGRKLRQMPVAALLALPGRSVVHLDLRAHFRDLFK